MFIALAIVVACVVVISIIQIQSDPDRPFFEAAYNNNLDDLVTLLYKENVEEHDALVTLSIAPQTTPGNLPATIALIRASPSGRIPTVSKEFLCRLVDRSGNTLFHWTAKNQALETAQFLFDIGCDFLRANFQGSSPFMWASTDQSLNPLTYTEYEMEAMLRDAELKRQLDLHDQEFAQSEDNRDAPGDILPHCTGSDSNSPTCLTSVRSSFDLTHDAEQPLLHQEQAKVSKTTPNNHAADAAKYTHIQFNPMLQLLASFAKQRDIRRYRDQLETDHLTMGHKKSLQQYVDEHLALYRPETLKTSYFHALLNHQNHGGENALHFAAQFLSVSSVKTIISLLPPPQDHSSLNVVTQVTNEAKNTAAHLLPRDCLEQNHCKKILTFFILIGFNPTTQNQYQRTLQHHIEYNQITPLLEIEDEFLVARYHNRQLEPHLQLQYNLIYGIASTNNTPPTTEDQIVKKSDAHNQSTTPPTVPTQPLQPKSRRTPL